MNDYYDCCDGMSLFIEDDRIPVTTNSLFREVVIYKIERSNVFLDYYIRNDPLHVGSVISYCPWCGMKLAPSLRKKWLEEIDNSPYGQDDFVLPDKALEASSTYHSDQWWKERGL